MAEERMGVKGFGMRNARFEREGNPRRMDVTGRRTKLEV